MPRKLTPEELSRRCDPGIFGFTTTAELHERTTIIGQERAMRSLDFGLSLLSQGFNIFALGEGGTGKSGAIRMLIEEKALREEVPGDWCYAFSFRNPDSPIVISLEPGKGSVFKKDMEDLVNLLRIEIPKVFESKEYEKQRSRIMEEFQRKQKDLFTALEEEAQSQGFAIRKATAGLLIVPIKKSGEPLTEEEFGALDEKTQKKVEETGRMLQERLDDIGRALREAEKMVKEMLRRLEREIALSALGSHIEDLKQKYRGQEKIMAYLDAVREDVLSHLDDFKTTEEQTPPLPFLKMPKSESSFERYSVNVIVNNGDQKGSPVVFESNPTYLNLFGKIEHKVHYGMAMTDFTMIRAGSLHRANGGYLVVNALDLLKNIFSYDALKRSLKNREIRMEDVWEQYRLMSTTALRPEPIPLDVKVVLIGNPYLYYLLYNLDEEFREFFKVKADFDSRMERNAENVNKYASFIASLQKEEGLLPFERTGVARLVEYGSRLAGHQERLSARLGEIIDLMRETNYWAMKEDSPVISASHVDKALNEKVFRVNRLEDRLRELTIEDTVIIETSGSRVGQVNGLAVLDLGDYSFGKPSRITAKTYIGKAGIVNIERETKMSGKIHDKAMFIISSYLGGKYARKKPISVAASITFEQLYEMVEGDSATCAELYALLSSISGVPIRQSFAVTGSMDQNGDVQPIGGVNEKIEGFFDVCKIRGLDGTHGVIIPRRNGRHLMLKQDVLDAVRDGKFSIYVMDRMEEGIEILTGVPAGEPAEDGSYPEGTVNHLVMKRFEEIAEALEKKKDKEEKEDKEKEVKEEETRKQEA